MSVDDKTRYGRVCLLVLNACPVGLSRFIEHNYTTNGFARFDGFLDQWNIKHNLFHLRFKICCSVHCTNANRSTPICTEQWDLLYKETLSRNPHGDGRKCPCMYTAIPGVTTEVMDVTLCCLLLRNCMSGGINMVHIEEICAVRNQILHSNSATLDEQTFNDIWRRLDKSLLYIAAQVSSEFHSEVRQTIKETMTSFCDNSREELVAARKMHDDLKNKTDLTLSQIRELFAEDDKETSQEQREKDNYSRLMQAVHGTGRAMMRDMRETLVNRASIENLEHLGQQTESQTPGNVPDMVSDDLQISTMNKMFAEYLKDDSVDMKNKFMLPTAKSEHFKSKESISFIEDIKTICFLDIFVKNNTAKSLKEHEYTEKWAQLMEVAERRGGVYVRSLSDLETRNIKLWNWKKLEQILDGCPVLEWKKEEFQIVMRTCTLNGSACYHSYIQSNKIYEYPICLTFIKQICSALNISTVPSSNVSCQHFQDRHTVSLTPSMSVTDKVAGQSTAHESSKDWKTSLKVITSQIVQKDVNITNGVTRSSNNPIKEENNKQNAFIGLAALVVSILLLALFFAYLYKRYQALTDLSRSINAMSDRTPRISIPPQADDEVYFEIYEIEECPVAELETDSRTSRYINDRATVEPQKHTTC